MDFVLSPKVNIDQSRCIRYNFSKTHCRYCEDICPVDAIRFGFPERVKIDFSICIKCGLCYAACPFGAIEISKDDEFIFLKSGQLKNIEVGCIFSDAEIKISCLSRLTDSLLFGWLQDKSVVIKKGNCSNCKFNATLSYFHKNLKSAIALLISFGVKFKLKIKTSPGDGVFIPKDSIDRRSIFSIAGKFKHSNTRREILLKLVKPFSLKQKKYFEDSGKISISPECNLCGVCEHICPMDAILVEKNEKSGLIKFNPALCVNCGECEQACLPQAIEIEDGDTSLLKSKPYVVFEAKMTFCESCGKPFYTSSSDKLCNRCRLREYEKNRLLEFLKDI